MCGIAGIISFNPKIITKAKLFKMTDALKHRGPDGQDVFINKNNTVGFAHTRLSIIDLTKESNQPFHYLHYTIVFNGEIYNYLKLKKYLIQKGYTFYTSSDTEVACAAFDYYGINAFNEFDGMFALAILDHKKNTVTLAKDYFGEKPLYYSIQNESFYFASEMKALWQTDVSKQFNNQQILNYLTLGYTSNPINNQETFYSNIQKLPSKHYIYYNLNDNSFAIRAYSKIDIYSTDENNKQQVFENLFSESILNRLNTDVDFGTSLSGGLDSSGIVAFIHQLNNSKHNSAKTFTASFNGFEKDEAKYSQLVAQQFNLQQLFTSPTVNDFLLHFNQVMFHQEEPLQSASAFIQYMVYALAKEHNVKVLLDGQGADEILGGYTKYAMWYLQELLTKNIFVFKKEKVLLQANDFLQSWNIYNYGAAISPKLASKFLTQKASKSILLNQYINNDFINDNYNKKTIEKPNIHHLNELLKYNTHYFGLEELLRYADRNSMANSVEVRLPFLNRTLVAFIESLAPSYKINNGFTKHILRKVLEPKLPKSIVWRKGKIGYEPPQKKWMQNNLVQEQIKESQLLLVNKKILKPTALSKKINPLNAHDSNNFDWFCLCLAKLF